MTTSERWFKAIDDACAEPDPIRSNQLITRLHYLLSEAITARLGREGGPNFHSWAVWGSRKAGTTIRQEDLGRAIGNATITACAMGCLLGTATGVIAGRSFGWSPDYLTTAMAAALGTLGGGWIGVALAIRKTSKAAHLMLRGNQIVIEDIGKQSARFLEFLEDGARSQDREAFFAGLRRGPTDQHGEDRLVAAFRCYLAAFDANDLELKRAAMIEGNCEIVFHEHLRLEPYIQGAMPFIVRRYVTQRWMSYEIGDRTLTVGEDVPGIPPPTAARNWAKV